MFLSKIFAAITILAVSLSGQIVIKAGKLIDPRSGKTLANQQILIQGDRIREVGATVNAPANAKVIDLSNATVLPGLIDNHTHVLLQGHPTTADYDEQLLKESIPFRAIRATVSARTALMDGFTTIRDLGTEGAMYADVDVKRAVARGIVPGPRMYVAARAFAGTGMYAPTGYSWELTVPDGVRVVDGVENIRRAVREEIKIGADWIKIYADRGNTFRDGQFHSRPNFADDEAKMFVEEAHRLGHKVAAHAQGVEGIESALRAGVDSIEHGYAMTDPIIDKMVRQGVYLCPTIYISIYFANLRGVNSGARQKAQEDGFRNAVKRGVKVAFGTDIGGFPWTDAPGKEFEWEVKWGMTPMQAIQSATINNAALLDMQDQLGAIEAGKFADIVAVAGDPLADITELQRIIFVMKGGAVYKQ